MSNERKTADLGTSQAAAGAVTKDSRPHNSTEAPQRQIGTTEIKTNVTPYDEALYHANLVFHWLEQESDGVDFKVLIKGSVAEFSMVHAKSLTDDERKAMVDFLGNRIGALPEEKRPKAHFIFFGETGDYDPLEKLAEEFGILAYGATWQDMDALIGPIEWEWQPWLSKGLLTLVAGEPGQGKSVLMLRIAATYLMGSDWPDSTPFAGEMGGVLWCESEAAQAINLDRAKQWGLPLERIYTPLDNPLDDAQLDREEHQDAIEKMAHRDDVRLIIVDSLRGAHRRDENSSATMEVCKWLAELARDTGKPILLSHHLRKRGMLDVADRVTLDRIRGSSAIIQTARMVWAIDAPDLDFDSNKRLSVIKSNLARFPEPVGFTIGDEMRLTFGDAPEAPHEETQMDKAIDLLRALLASGPVATNDLKDETIGAGISWPTVTRAKKKLGIVARKTDNKWSWALPARGDDTPH